METKYFNNGFVGKAVFNANAMDKYVKALVNRIGKIMWI